MNLNLKNEEDYFMLKDKMRSCKSCGHEISAIGNVTCPSCGRLNKKPIYKRAWFIILAIIFGLIFLNNLASDDEKVPTGSQMKSSNSETTEKTDSATNSPIPDETLQPVKPIDVTVDQLHEALESNALKASQTYKNQYVRLRGRLSTIDSSGKYFSLVNVANEFSFKSILCNIQDRHLDRVVNFQDNQIVTVVGEITAVGEVMGYTLEVDMIE